MADARDRRLVYDTAVGIGRIRYCKRCGAPESECRCHSNNAPVAPNDGFVRLARDRKNRGGKTVTTVRGLPGDHAALAKLAQELRRLCGAGGTLTPDGVVEVQGDHRDKIEAYLVAHGHRVKRVGG